MNLAQYYLARYANRFDAYMAFQRALMHRFILRGGTKEDWCERFAPAFRRRYGEFFGALPADGETLR